MIGISGPQLVLYEGGYIELDIPKPDYWWWCQFCEEFHPGYYHQHEVCEKDPENEQ